MSRPRFSIRQHPKEESETSPKKESYIKPEEAKASSMDYQNFGSGHIKLSLEVSQEASSVKPPSIKTLQPSQGKQEDSKSSDDIYKPKNSLAGTHRALHTSPSHGNIFFNFLNQMIVKQQKGLSEIHKGNVG